METKFVVMEGNKCFGKRKSLTEPLGSQVVQYKVQQCDKVQVVAHTWDYCQGHLSLSQSQVAPSAPLLNNQDVYKYLALPLPQSVYMSSHFSCIFRFLPLCLSCFPCRPTSCLFMCRGPSRQLVSAYSWFSIDCSVDTYS